RRDVVVLFPFYVLAVLDPHRGKMRLPSVQVSADADWPKAFRGHFSYRGGIGLRCEVVPDFSCGFRAILDRGGGVAHFPIGVVTVEIDEAIAFFCGIIEPRLIRIGRSAIRLPKGLTGKRCRGEHAISSPCRERTIVHKRSP